VPAVPGQLSRHDEPANSASTVRMVKEIMTSLLPDDFKAEFSKGFDEALRREGRECAHAVTATL
jgi:hypothetical protein